MLKKIKQEAPLRDPQSPSIHLEQLRGELDSLRLRLSMAEFSAARSQEDEFAKTQLVNEIIKSRRLRDVAFGADIFGEPAWDILLELYLAQQQQRRTTISDACRASASPQTTGLRWIRLLEERGWVKRHSDPLDGRRVFLSLTNRTNAAMDDYLGNLAIKVV